MTTRTKTAVFLVGYCALTVSATSQASLSLSTSPLEVTANVRPNILLIPDTSESMQEGLSRGRVGLDWDSCIPGPDMDPEECVAGARYENSKGSIVKRVGLDLVNNFQDSINMGMMSYQQAPPSTERNDVFDFAATPGTVLWRLTHRPADLRFALEEDPDFFDPDHSGDWDSPTKRFREEHPTLDGVWVFYNVAVPGYIRDTQEGHPPVQDSTEFAYRDRPDNSNPYRIYDDMQLSGIVLQDPDSGLWFTGQIGGTWRITLTDSMRQRGVTGWGDRVGFVELGQPEWRANTSPGLGYLHVPIGGYDEEGNLDAEHWDNIEQKLQPQRHDWEESDGNVLVDAEWPLIAAGLTPLEGTMLTARDYFLSEEEYFGPDQGNLGDTTIPDSCDVNAAIWVTDGLPSVGPDGTALGDDPVTALEGAEQAIEAFHEETGVSAFIVGFALPPGVADLEGMPEDPLDSLASAGGTEEAFQADSEEGLNDIMNQILQNVVDASISASGVTASTTELELDSAIFQAEMDSSNWSGELRAFSINPNGSRSEEPMWEAGQLLTDSLESSMAAVTSRRIVTNDPEEGGVLFAEGDGGLTETLQDRLTLASDPEDAELWRDRVNYMRGDRSSESEPDFRARATGLLGHIAKSEPTFVPGDENRPDMIYVAANDGMVHGFNADSGEEVMAFMPGSIMDRVPAFTSPDYEGQFLLDGQLDAVVEDGDATVVGTTGGAGQSVFAIDVSDPESFGSDDFLWEFEHEALGFTIGHPRITQLANGDTGIILGNGYNSDSVDAALFVLNLDTTDIGGDLIRLLEVDGRGVATPAVLDSSRNGVADYVYAGDFDGNLWKFDLAAEDASDWGLYDFDGGGSDPMFEAGNGQPVTSSPAIASHPDGGVIVVFGTGEFLTSDSPTDTTVQTVYGLRDRFDGQAPTSLVEQTVLNEEGDFRVTSGNVVRTADDGWYLELPASGERVLSNPIIRRGEVLIGSFVPTEDKCDAGGFGYLTILDAFSGAGPDTPVFDDGDGLDEDLLIDGDAPSSRRVDGIIRTPAVIGDRERDLLFTGDEDMERETGYGRQSWRELE